MQVKPTNPNTKWIRKIKAFPDKQTVTVYAKRWNLWGCVYVGGHAGWDWTLGKSFFGYTYDHCCQLPHLKPAQLF